MASCFASSVLPTPVGPVNRKHPAGRSGWPEAGARPLDGGCDEAARPLPARTRRGPATLRACAACACRTPKPGGRGCWPCARRCARSRGRRRWTGCRLLTARSGSRSSRDSAARSAGLKSGLRRVTDSLGGSARSGSCDAVAERDRFIAVLIPHRSPPGARRAADARRVAGFDPGHGAGFVEQIDRAVGQAQVAQVAGREPRGGIDRLVGVADVVVFLVAPLQALEDADGLLDGRLVDRHLLQPPWRARGRVRCA